MSQPPAKPPALSATALELCYLIERCGASEDLTEASVRASEIRQGIVRMEEKIKAAKLLTCHALDAICYDPAKYWLLGNGTGTWEKLTAAHAALFDKDLETVRKEWHPDPVRYEAYQEERAAHQWMIDHCKDNGIHKPTAED